ncbi:MAG: hypothetical protein ACREO4_09205 [Lysobacter sp.]
MNAHKLADALRAMPDDVDMIEHNPDEGARYFCCGREVSFNVHPSRWPAGSIQGRTHAGDCWYTAARAALAQHDAQQDAPRVLAAECHALADALRERRDALPGARTIPTARAQFDLATVERHLHGIADNMDTTPADYGDPTRPGDSLRLDHFALQRDGLALVTDSQDVRAAVDALSVAELAALDVAAYTEAGELAATGALVATADGDYSEIWLTDSARPFDLIRAHYTRAR